MMKLPCKRLFRTIAVFLLLSKTAWAISFIQVVNSDSNNNNNNARSSFTGESSAAAAALISIDNNDLFRMPRILFQGGGVGKDESTTIEFTKAKAKRTSSRQTVIWHGSWIRNSTTTDDLTSFATLYSTGNNSLTGTIVTPRGAYSISTITNSQQQQQHQVIFTAWEDFPPEGEAIKTPNDNDNNNGGATGDDDAFLFQPSLAIVQNNKDNDVDDWEVDSGPAAIVPTDRRRNLLRENEDGRDLQLFNSPTVDLLVIVTNRAACANAGVSAACTITESIQAEMDAQIGIAVADTNEGMTATGALARVRLVSTIYMARNTWDITTSGPDLRDVIESNQISSWRTQHGADLVTIITNGGPNCGLAYLNDWPSLISYRCLAGYSMSHELGHCFGCLHNREDTDDESPYAYGYQSPSHTYRTFLAYDCRDRSCPRVPYYSTPNYQLPDGRPLGTSRENNARQISDTARSVSSWKASRYVETQPTQPPPTQPPPTTNTNPPALPPGPIQEITCPTRCSGGSSNNENRMYRTFLFGLVCTSRCVAEPWYGVSASLGWSCEPCEGVVDFSRIGRNK